ncbi:hypothetical protein CF65_00295 [Aggregatibacter actinomycetemcomitans HK1651]|nr:hypothetical protein CF65_00295 [Aggregatibacter actinomycetemcomitans HK1651]
MGVVSARIVLLLRDSLVSPLHSLFKNAAKIHRTFL